MKRFFKDAVGVTISKVVVSAISIVYTMLLARFRTLEDYGTYSELLLIVNIVSTVFFLGLPYSVNYFLPRSDSSEEKQKFIDTYLSTVITVGIFAGFIIILMIPAWELYFSNANISAYWFFLLLFPLTKILNTGADNIFINFERVRLLIAYRLLHSVLQLAIVIIIELLGMSFRAYMFFYIVLEMVFSLFVVVFIRSQVGTIRYHIDKGFLKKILVFSIPLGLSSAVGAVNVEMDKLIIGRFLSTDELAIYANASREMPVSLLSASFTTVLIPKLSKMIKDGKYRSAVNLWDKVTCFSFTIIIFFVFFFACHARETMVLLYSDKYLSGYKVFIVYSNILVFQSAYFGIFLNVTGNTKYIFWGSLMSMLCNAVLNVICYFIFGFYGPAVSTLLCTTILAIYQLAVTSRKININIKNMFTLKEYLYPLACAVSISIVYEIIKKTAGIEILSVTQTIISGIIWFTVYASMNYGRMKRNILRLRNEEV